MSEMKDGGPAFPSQRLGADGMPSCEADSGMSLRDWFAGQALLATAGYRESADIDDIARQSYAIADAMLKARQDKP